MVEKVKHKGLALAVLAAAQFMVVLDATIVNVALPAIQQSLGFSSDAQLQWVVTAYALVFGGFLLLGGRLADLFGRRGIFLAGVGIFAASSLLAGVAQNPGTLILFRALQGLGGALLSPAALSLLLTIFKEGPERNRALGIWSMVAGGGGAVGLLLGGVLTQYIDWRWIFFINIPIAAAIIAAALKYVPRSLPTNNRPKLDIVGALTVTAGLMSLVYALAKAPDNGWTDATTLGFFAAAAVLLIAFIINELRVKEPLINLSIFRRRNVSGTAIIQTLMPAAMFGMFFYMSIYLQQFLGYSPTHTGLANLPFTVVMIVTAGILSKKIGNINPKIILVVAPLFVTAGLLYFSRLPVNSSYWVDILPGIAVMATGIAGVFVAATLVATSGVSHKESGLISGVLNTSQQIGGAIGLAVLTVISTSVTRSDMSEAHGDPSALTSSLVHGFQHAFVAAACFAAAASVLALIVIKTKKPTKADIGHEAEVDAEALPAIPGV